jgi:hypothetical protein
MDKPHISRLVRRLGFFNDHAHLTHEHIYGAGDCLQFLFREQMEALCNCRRLAPDPECSPIDYPQLYHKGKYRVAGNLIQKAVTYFLRAPVYIGQDGSHNLSPIPAGRFINYQYFHGKQKEYRAFLLKWSSDLDTKCKGFFGWLTRALAQPLPRKVRVKANASREWARFILDFSVNIDGLGTLMQPLEATATVEDFLLQLIPLAAIVNEYNLWFQEDEALRQPDLTQRYLTLYDGVFAEECIRMFHSLLVTSMSPLRLAWMGAVGRGRQYYEKAKLPRARSSRKHARMMIEDGSKGGRSRTHRNSSTKSSKCSIM